MKSIAATIGLNGRRDILWLDANYAMSTTHTGGPQALHLGGDFTSVAAAVATTVRVNPTDVNPTDTTRPPTRLARESNTGSSSTTTTAAAVTGVHHVGPGITKQVQRLDVFALAQDFAMYHKACIDLEDKDNLGGWENLGGTFTSAPAAIAWPEDNSIDVFAVGFDHSLYVRSLIGGSSWANDWQSLGGGFTSAASLVPMSATQLRVFVRGSDFTLRGNQRDDATGWSDWENHDGQLASPPVAVSWGPNRVDVFAVQRDATLGHIWWDGMIWSDWESLGEAIYTGEPAVVSTAPGRLDVFVQASDGTLHHHLFADNVWHNPETQNTGGDPMIGSPTAVSAGQGQIEVLYPVQDATQDSAIRSNLFAGSSWSYGTWIGNLRIPQRYRIEVRSIRADTPRSLESDSDGAAATLTVGDVSPLTKTAWVGEIGGPTHPTEVSMFNSLEFYGVTVDLAEPMSFSYVVVNNGHDEPSKVLASLANAGNGLGSDGTTSMEEDIAKNVVKIVEAKLTGALSVSVPVIGSILSMAENWILGQLTNIIFQKCDGLVAAELRAMIGRDLFALTTNGTKTATVVTEHKGTDSNPGCGANSDYHVTWSVEPL